MKKIPVLPGVWWVDIPQCDLRILCGAPMDSIKHLIRGGLVKAVELDGKSYETGPNAILLSDRAIQNGCFWNLVEFPVLHMMFRQGMAIPGHPGNTGAKPLIIGRRDQVEATQTYIQRGNYGLMSPEEMKQFGLPEVHIEDLWRLKLKFASGSLKTIDELVDVAVVDDGLCEIAPEIFLKRMGDNQYRFSTQKESLEVDLNLPEGENWKPSYTLPQKRVEDAFFSVVHSGEGNGWDPTRPCMGSLLNYRGRRFLVDAGPGIEYSLDCLGMDIDEIDGLFLTHAHDDHFAGFTQLFNRERPIPVYATESVMATIRMKCAALLDKEFHYLDSFTNIRHLQENIWNNVDGLEIRPVISPHPIETTIFFFRTNRDGDSGSYAHFGDIISREVMDGYMGEEGVSAKFVEKIFDDYAQKADVKKIDAGLGLVHGSAVDFARDRSGKVILSHTEIKVRESDEAFGVPVDFGDNDIIIARKEQDLRDEIVDILKRSPLRHASERFNDFVELEPESYASGTLVPDSGGVEASLLLILSGCILASQKDSSATLRYLPGALVGEGRVLSVSSDDSIYRTHHPAKVLRIPANLYRESLGVEQIERRRLVLSHRESFVCHRFFGTRFSANRLDDIAEQCEPMAMKKGSRLDVGKGSKDALYLILRGEFRSQSDGKRCGHSSILNWSRIRPFGEIATKEKWKALVDSELFVVPGALIRDIPVLCWMREEYHIPA